MADEDLSPDLEDLKIEIEKSAGVDEEVKDTVPSSDAVPEKDSKGAAMEKAGAALAGVAAKTEGVTDDEDAGPEEEATQLGLQQ